MLGCRSQRSRADSRLCPLRLLLPARTGSPVPTQGRSAARLPRLSGNTFWREAGLQQPLPASPDRPVLEGATRKPASRVHTASCASFSRTSPSLPRKHPQSGPARPREPPRQRCENCTAQRKPNFLQTVHNIPRAGRQMGTFSSSSSTFCIFRGAPLARGRRAGVGGPAINLQALAGRPGGRLSLGGIDRL